MPGLKFSIMGDSISTFEGCTPDGYTLFYNDERLEKSGVITSHDTWWWHVAHALGGEILADDAWSGSMVDGAGFPAAKSPERAAALLGPNGETPDVVIAFIGINDFGWGGAAAQAAGHSHAMPKCIDPATVPEQVAGAAPADAAKQFGNAYRTMLHNIRAVAPDALVYCVTLLPGRTHGVDHPEFTYRLRGVHLDEYNSAIRKAAAAESCRVADVRAFGRDYDSLEGTHPTNLGMCQFASMIVRAMQLADENAAAQVEASSTEAVVGATFGTEPAVTNPALDLRNFRNAPESAELCDKPSCIGCPHAANTGNSWLCRCLK